MIDATKYIAEPSLVTMLYLSYKTGKPLLIEGPPGTGKTAIAEIIAQVLQRKLIRLQCYEGIDENRILYEWQYSKQILYSNLMKELRTRNIISSGGTNSPVINEVEEIAKIKDEIFSESFLLLRPLAEAILSKEPVVLLIDEIDRADAEIEAMMLEIFGEAQITIPELGTLKARSQPLVVITSNKKRRLSEALQRRCFYYYTNYPDPKKETQILMKHKPHLPEQFLEKVSNAMNQIRNLQNLIKPPSISESLDLIELLLELYTDKLSEQGISETLGVILKVQEDLMQHKQNALNILKNQELDKKQIQIS